MIGDEHRFSTALSPFCLCHSHSVYMCVCACVCVSLSHLLSLAFSKLMLKSERLYKDMNVGLMILASHFRADDTRTCGRRATAWMLDGLLPAPFLKSPPSPQKTLVSKADCYDILFPVVSPNSQSFLINFLDFSLFPLLYSIYCLRPKMSEQRMYME